jgi:uracil-DNA glycosylase
MKNSEMLQMLSEKVCECKKCPELITNRIQPVMSSGNSDAKILILGEAPGKDEDESGEAFVGDAGKLLSNIIKACGLSRKNDVYICNVLKCRPPKNRRPKKDEIENCGPFLKLQIKVLNPKLILCLGDVAAQHLLKVEVPISHLRGRWFNYKDAIVNADVLCTYHPGYLLRNPSAKKEVWDDIQVLLTRLPQS